jgi:predicted KAP-like P-loop ATPase
MAEEKETQFDKFAQRIPELNIVSDNPLKDEDVEDEQFNLRYRVGPIFDIIRNDKTQTPMTIAIYGTWGTGKTTAMQWLDRLLRGWNNHLLNNPEITNQRKVRTVWFYPWKYHNKDDVWKGLIAEVILNVTDFEQASTVAVLKSLKLLSIFLGKSVLDILSDAEFEVAGFKVKSSVIRKIKKNFQKAKHPEKPYLNEYEDSFKGWIKDALSQKNERMVIFIDDLDRCMPGIALQVLEALKLYLNIKDLIFIIGLDREIIDKIVENHYEKFGFDTEPEKIKCKKYLDKMFQVEVRVGPSLKQIREYTDYILEQNEFLKNNLKPNEYGAVKAVVLSLAGRNPREIKRLVNSALMEGMGANLISKEVEDGQED